MWYNEIVNKYDGNFSVWLSLIGCAIKSFKKFCVSETAECPSVSICIKYPWHNQKMTIFSFETDVN